MGTRVRQFIGLMVALCLISSVLVHAEARPKDSEAVSTLNNLMAKLANGDNVDPAWEPLLRRSNPADLSKPMAAYLKKESTRPFAFRLAKELGVPNLGAAVWSVYKKKGKEELTIDACEIALRDADPKYENELVDRFIECAASDAELPVIKGALCNHTPSYQNILKLLKHAEANEPEGEGEAREAKEAVYSAVEEILHASFGANPGAIKGGAAKENFDEIFTAAVLKVKTKSKPKGADYTRHLHAKGSSRTHRLGTVLLIDGRGRESVASLDDLPAALSSGDFIIRLQVYLQKGMTGEVSVYTEKGGYGIAVVDGEWCIRVKDGFGDLKTKVKFNEWQSIEVYQWQNNDPAKGAIGGLERITVNGEVLLPQGTSNFPPKEIRLEAKGGALLISGIEIECK